MPSVGAGEWLMSQPNELVYVVDDDASVRRALTRVFRAAGYEVLAFESAYEFLDRQPSDTPTCLVLDIRMPGMSGLELADQLRDSGSTLPIVLITGHEYEHREPLPPVLACLHKPLNSDKILDTVGEGFRKQHSDE